MSVLLALFRLLPAFLASLVTRGAAAVAWALGVRRRVAMENLALAFPELPAKERRRLARASFRHLGLCAADFLLSPRLADEALFAMVDDDDWRVVAPLLAARTGFIVATAHLGNFELFGAYAARRGVPLTALTRRLSGAANARWTGTRAESGMRELHGGPGRMIEVVRGGGVLALLIDQNMLPKRAVFAPFFGRLAATTPAPAVLAERTGAPVVLGLLMRKADGRYRVVFEGPFHFERTAASRQEDVLAFTRMLNLRLERHVRQHPEQWFWVHRRFKTRPPAKPR